MKEIDCFLIGHNEININKMRQILRIGFGKNSHRYRETNKSYLGHIKYKNKWFSPSDLFNYFNKDKSIVDSSFDEMDINETFSLAVAYLGTYLRKNGFSIEYINSFNKEKDLLKNNLINNKINVIAITTTYYILSYPIYEIVSFIKKYNPDVKIVVGGPFIANRIRSLNDNQDIQKLFKSIGADIYIYSTEGESALSEVVKSVKNDMPLDNIPNIYYKNDLNKFVFTKSLQENNSLDDNIVDWDYFTEKIGRFVNIRTTKSCPFSCSFCSYPKYAGKYQLSSVDSIEKELKDLDEMNKVAGIWIIDDSFNFPPKRFKETLKMMIKNKFKFKWHSFFRSQYVDREMVELMKESGCIHVLIGVESGNNQILKNMNKKATVEQYEKGLELLNEYGIASTVSVIVGFPGETYESYLDTISFIERTQPTFYRAHLWLYDHCTPIHKERSKYKLSGEGYNWKHSTMDSDTAQKLVLDFFMNIRNSTFEAECPVPFHMLIRDIPLSTIKNYLDMFNSFIINRLKNPEKESIDDSDLSNIRKILDFSLI